MFLISGQKAKLIQYNRQDDNKIFDDQNKREVYIKCCPYDISQGIRYGIYTVPEAKGYYQVPRSVDVRQGDQIIFYGRNQNKDDFQEQTHTILEVQDCWLFNRVENKILAVK